MIVLLDGMRAYLHTQCVVPRFLGGRLGRGTLFLHNGGRIALAGGHFVNFMTYVLPSYMVHGTVQERVGNWIASSVVEVAGGAEQLLASHGDA